MEKYFWSYGPQVQIVVNNVMNMSTLAGQRQATANIVICAAESRGHSTAKQNHGLVIVTRTLLISIGR